ncbi:hypothetical protein G6F37_011725 [Rhizopus arrhizus]|nr:hypothetical protein G6F38_011992 [Rhizopus arrhizus]KAG1147790.1 hypothetical protein G6F37_011725 [Rhizopus arrhizus]
MVSLYREVRTDDYCRLRYHLDRYGSVFNAKVNIHKTEAFSLDGRSYPEWIAFLAAQGISKWHDHSLPAPIRYLGFPLIQSFHQHHYLEQQLLQTVKSQCTIYSQRRLSLKGRVAIMNALILSKLCLSGITANLDNELFIFGIQCSADHPSRSLIIDPYDENYTQYKVFTPEELEEIKEYQKKSMSFPTKEFKTFLNSYNLDSSQKIRTALGINHQFHANYDKDINADEDWVNHVVNSSVWEYEFGNMDQQSVIDIHRKGSRKT